MKELIKQTLSNLSANKTRSFLTMFGIIWGVISIVILSAVGEGFQRGNQAVLRELGKNIAIIRNGRTSMQAGGARAGRIIRLTIDDVHLLKERSKVIEFISPEIQRYGVKVKSSFNSASLQVCGVWPVYQHIRTIEVEKGRLMNEIDNQEARRVVVIGFNVSKQLFADRNPIGLQVNLNGMPYTVIGKMRKKNQDSDYSGQDDDHVFTTFEAMRKDLPLNGESDTADSLTTIIAAPYQRVADDIDRMMSQGFKANLFETNSPVEKEIRAILAPKHNFDPDDVEAVSIWNTAIESVMFNRIVGSMREFFIAVSLITLALGGIGVMNIMLISVKERTKEIGVRKALGATSMNILWQFFSEGLFLTLLSGLIGFGCGFGLCQLINLLPMPARFSGMIVTWQTAVFSIAILALIGVIAATYPARRAAAMQPIEALRYEM